MEDEDVIGNDPATAEVPDKGQPKEDVTISRSELESLRRELHESRESELAWASFHRNGGKQPEPKAGEPEETLDADQFVDADTDEGVKDDDPGKFVDDIAARGMKAIADRGMVTKAEARRIAVEMAEKVTRELMGRETQKQTSDRMIMEEFPELRQLMKDPEAQKTSPLWAETAKRYQKAVAMDPRAAKTPAALYLAADAAREFLKSKKAARQETDEDDERGNREDEAQRRHRADSQDSRPRGRREVIDDSDDMLGREAREVIEKMGITPDQYKASRRETLGRKR
jgi:hypothetical protein